MVRALTAEELNEWLQYGDLLLPREWHRSGNSLALRFVETSLEKMARSGIYDQLGGGFHRYSVDQLGGGFHRYSVDQRWLVPHFERMLYDNTQVARVYLHTWQVTGYEFFRAIREEILDYVVREMTDSTGGFYRKAPRLVSA